MNIIERCFICDAFMFLPGINNTLPFQTKIANSFIRIRKPVCRRCQKERLLGDAINQ